MDKNRQPNISGNEKLCIHVSTAFFIAFIVLAGWRIIHAADPDPLSQVKDGVEKILNILNDEQLVLPEMRAERRRQVEAVVDDVFDFREMARRSLAKNWEQRTPEEKVRFVNLFSRLVKQRYIGKVDSYSGQKIVFKKQIVKKKSAIIYSLIIDNGIDIPIDYKLTNKKDKWWVYDLRVENVSLLVNYRRDFFSIIKQDGYDGLVKRLEEKNEKFETSK